MSGKKAAGTGAKATPASTAPKAPVAPAAGAKANPAQNQKEIDDATKAAIASQKDATAQTQEGAKVIDPNATSAAGENGKPSSTVIPQTAGTQEQPAVTPAVLSEAHQQEIVRAFGLFGVGAIALQTATFEELKATNDAKQKELDIAANTTQNTNQISPNAIKTNEAALGGEFVADDNHVIAEKNGEKKRFTKTTWRLMQDAPDQWKLVPSTPPEVQNLSK